MNNDLLTLNEYRDENKFLLEQIRILWNGVFGDIPGPPPADIAVDEIINYVKHLEELARKNRISSIN
jgi:hypothetical protein